MYGGYRRTHMSRSNSTRTDDKIVLLGHPPGSFHDLFLVIRDDLDLLELDPEVETLFGEKVAVRVAIGRKETHSVRILRVFMVT
jgi:hypothetical protein